MESSSHSQVATAEIMLRMIYIHSPDNEGEGESPDEGNIDQAYRNNESEKIHKSEKENFSSVVGGREFSISCKRPKGGSVSHHRPTNSSSNHSIVFPQKGLFFDKLSQEMRVFVASDTLNSLLAASSSSITAETLILVILMLVLFRYRDASAI